MKGFPRAPFIWGGGGSIFLTLPAFPGLMAGLPPCTPSSRLSPDSPTDDQENLQRCFLLLVRLFFLCSSPDQLHSSLQGWDGADLGGGVPPSAEGGLHLLRTLNQKSLIPVRKRQTQQEGFCLLPNLGHGMGKEKEKGKENPTIVALYVTPWHSKLNP